MSQNINSAITDFLDYYFALEFEPEYAVLIRGSWGSGKTWFIKDYIKGKEDFLYVSLYGVTSFKDIDDAFFNQLHPFLASKGIKAIGAITKGFLKNAKIELDKIDVNDFLVKITNKKIIFDDLERCSMSIQNTLGYINQLVEGNGLKVVILANEEEINKLDIRKGNADNVTAYHSIKEKLIGKNFDLQVDIDHSINYFLSTINGDSGQVLKQNVDLIRSVFKTAKYFNLRHLKQTILDFERFFELFDSKAKKKEDLIQYLIAVFFIISFELKKGDINESDISSLLSFSVKKGVDDKTTIDDIKEKYYSIFNFIPNVDVQLWQDFFRMGTIEKSTLREYLENSIYYLNEKIPTWKKLWHYLDLDKDKEFEDLFQAVFDDLKKTTIGNKYELLHIVGMLVQNSADGLIPYTKAEIIELGRKNLAALKITGRLNIKKDEEFPKSGYDGLGFSGLNIPEIKDFIKEMQAEIEIVKNGHLPNDAKQLIKLMETDWQKFSEKMYVNNIGDNEYVDVPILHYMDTDEFITALLSVKNAQKKYLAHVFERRYRFPDYNRVLQVELPWLKNLLVKLEELSEKKIGKITKQVISLFVIEDIGKGIALLEASEV